MPTALHPLPKSGAREDEKDSGSIEKKKIRFLNRRRISRDSSGSSQTEKRAVLVMGGTGLVGGAVVRGLLSYPWFRVLVGTRRPWCADAALLKQAGATLVEVDFNYKHSLVMAMKEVKCVFLHTVYWENYSCTLEIVQGRNAVEAAIEAGVEHLVFDGTNYRKPEEGRVCGFLRSKLEIEDYIVRSGIGYTIVVLPFYFEHLLTVFRPHVIQTDVFALMLPLENCFISCACLHDMAICICKIIQQTRLYLGQKLILAAEMLSVQQMTTALNNNLKGLDFIDPEITAREFMDFDFLGAKDLAAMFLFYQLCEDIPDFSITKTLNPNTRNMVQWIIDNRAQLYSVLDEDGPTDHGDYVRPPHLRISENSDTTSGQQNDDEDDDDEVFLHVPSKPPVHFQDDMGSNQSNNSDDYIKADGGSLTARKEAKKRRATLRLMSHMRSMAIHKFLQEDFTTVCRTQERRGAPTGFEHGAAPTSKAPKKKARRVLTKVMTWFRDVLRRRPTAKDQTRRSWSSPREDDEEAGPTGDESFFSVTSRNSLHVGQAEADKPISQFQSTNDLQPFLDAYVSMKLATAAPEEGGEASAAELRSSLVSESSGSVEEARNSEREAWVTASPVPQLTWLGSESNRTPLAPDWTRDAPRIRGEQLPLLSDSTDEAHTTNYEDRERAMRSKREPAANAKRKSSSTLSSLSSRHIPGTTETADRKDSAYSNSLSAKPTCSCDDQERRLEESPETATRVKMSGAESAWSSRLRHEDVEPPLLVWPESMETAETTDSVASTLSSPARPADEETPLSVWPESRETMTKTDSVSSTLSLRTPRGEEQSPHPVYRKMRTKTDGTPSGDLVPEMPEAIGETEIPSFPCSGNTAAEEPRDLSTPKDTTKQKRRPRVPGKRRFPPLSSRAREEVNCSNNGSGSEIHVYVVPLCGRALPGESEAPCLRPVLRGTGSTVDKMDVVRLQRDGSRGHTPFVSGPRAPPPVPVNLATAESFHGEDFCLPGYTGVEEKVTRGRPKEGEARPPCFGAGAVSAVDPSARRGGRGPTFRASRGEGEKARGGGNADKISSSELNAAGRVGQSGGGAVVTPDAGGGFKGERPEKKRPADGDCYTGAGLQRDPSPCVYKTPDPAYRAKPRRRRLATSDKAERSAYCDRTGLKRAPRPPSNKTTGFACHARPGHTPIPSFATRDFAFSNRPRYKSRGRGRGSASDDKGKQAASTQHSDTGATSAGRQAGLDDKTNPARNATTGTDKGALPVWYDRENADERRFRREGWKLDEGPLSDSSYKHPVATRRHLLDPDDSYQVQLNRNMSDAVMALLKTKNPSKLAEIIDRHNRGTQEERRPQQPLSRRGLSSSDEGEKMDTISSTSPSPPLPSSAAPSSSSPAPSVGDDDEAAFLRNKWQFLRYVLDKGGEIPDDLVVDTSGLSPWGRAGCSRDGGADEDGSMEVITYRSPESSSSSFDSRLYPDDSMPTKD